MGLEFDEDSMAKAICSHEANNYANAYFLPITPAEASALNDGDLNACTKAFSEFQRNHYGEANSAKNASLYVDFRYGRFVSPNEMISEEMTAEIADKNRDFIKLSEHKAEVMQIVLSDDGALKDAMESFYRRASDLKKEATNDMEGVYAQFVNDLLEMYKAGSTGKRDA